ncbi:hypothetical protein GIB67_025288 [Kingdonia uniflora]|uniref:Pentatricopeptide repeat-containing protein n=1 Tax=Kingdonia uniflora TaxID=39325 RepID=A0A7J7NBW4_9MAGN|nr:hypothetical protein GIB67_025288 [Kingdonia uniflora]
MQAIQALKRTKLDTNKLNHILTTTLPRLLKSDLLASLSELLRQNQCHLALKLFAATKSEAWYKPDIGLYADMVLALARNNMVGEIDGLVLELSGEGWVCDRGVSRLVKALVVAERGESLVRVYEMMRESGVVVDEYLVKVLSRGLRRLGEESVADEVEREFGDCLNV